MAAKYILAVLAAAFLAAAAWQRARAGAAPDLKSRTWSLIGVIFAVVSAWLFYREGTG